MKGRVVKILSREYTVSAEGALYVCAGRKKLKREGEVYVGDFVEIADNGGAWTIEGVLERKNRLIRPYVANVDVCLIVVAPYPEADYVLVDKIIVNCLMNGIEPVLVVNKSDVGAVNVVDEDYARFTRVKVSARTGEGMQELRSAISGKVCCMAGQSAVGKTSILNALTGRSATTGGLSKIMRGKNTTRHIECYDLGEGTLLMDTCGFSLFELDIKCEDLRLCYDEFMEAGQCRFATCKHVNEPDCAVKAAVESGEIPKGRYERYKVIYEELKRRKTYE